MIGLVGSPFSGRYARARRRGPAEATDFVAHHVALHGPATDDWCLTENGASALARSATSLAIGASSWHVAGDMLVVRLDERTAPLARRVAGEIRVHLEGAAGPGVALDDAGRHRWWPIAPAARAEVELTQPSAHFSGTAYVDAQQGDEPLEEAFRSWTWSRVHTDGEAVVDFDILRRDGSRLSLARRYTRGADGAGREEPARPAHALATTRWGLPRTCRSEMPARLVRRLEDGPCYARALVETSAGGRPASGVHEVLDLDRLSSGWVRFLMPFRTRRGS